MLTLGSKIAYLIQWPSLLYSEAMTMQAPNTIRAGEESDRDQLIEMAAEQFANLFWQHVIFMEKQKRNKSRRKKRKRGIA